MQPETVYNGLDLTETEGAGNVLCHTGRHPGVPRFKLQEVCRGDCTEKCKQSCKKENCDRRPFHVLFEGESSAEKQEN